MTLVCDDSTGDVGPGKLRSRNPILLHHKSIAVCDSAIFKFANQLAICMHTLEDVNVAVRSTLRTIVLSAFMVC